MVNEENKGGKIVGGRPLESYVDGLKQILNVNDLQPKEPPLLFSLLDKDNLLFSKEIEVMYDPEQSDLHSFVDKELASVAYEVKKFQLRHIQRSQTLNL